MKRKLVKQGAATMMISLPAKWIKQFKLDKGDEVEIEPIDNNLLVSVGGIKKKLETELNITNRTESSIRTLITNTYRLGYDRVKVYFNDKTSFDVLSNVVKTRLLGFDVIKKEKNQCIIESITEPSMEQFDVLFNKIFYNIVELFEIIEKRLNKKETNMNYEEIEEKIQQYDNFCRRVIMKKNISNKESHLSWAFLTLVIHGQRELYHLSRFLDKNNVNISNRVLDLLNKAKNIFNLLKTAYQKKDIKVTENIHEIEKDLIYKKAYSLFSEKKGKEMIIIYHLSSSIRNFYLAASPLAGLLV
ncbi:MAG: AbrB/MazE/SpoVT family DNA-binding domain-containing protein [Nanoarchaeota archaeon]|nr:AbrB/MazE/SpoVT family DNA-binding domain-containing protein [Nanoarchaeota archaeon]